MPVQPRRFLVSSPRRTALALFALAAGLAAAGCGEQPPGEDDAAADADVYEVRGEFLGETGDGAWQIRHERIDDFKAADGEVAPMDVMVMAFPPAEGVSMGEIEPGDPVAFTFEVRWRGEDRGWTLTAIEPLPADTPLDFGEGDAAGMGAMDGVDHDHSTHGHGETGGGASDDHAGHGH